MVYVCLCLSIVAAPLISNPSFEGCCISVQSSFQRLCGDCFFKLNTLFGCEEPSWEQASLTAYVGLEPSCDFNIGACTIFRQIMYISTLLVLESVPVSHPPHWPIQCDLTDLSNLLFSRQQLWIDWRLLEMQLPGLERKLAKLKEERSSSGERRSIWLASLKSGRCRTSLFRVMNSGWFYTHTIHL